MRIVFCLLLAWVWPAVALAEARFSVTRDGGSGADAVTRTIALYCAKDDLSDCRVLRAQGPTEEKSVRVTQAWAKELLEAGSQSLAPFVPTSGKRKSRLRWALLDPGKSLEGSLSVDDAKARRALTEALMRLEQRLNRELSR